jgi:hypothetical protein
MVRLSEKRSEVTKKQVTPFGTSASTDTRKGEHDPHVEKERGQGMMNDREESDE